MAKAIEHLPRVRLSRSAYVTLTEWQLRALRERGVKPSYSDLVDTMVDLIEGHELDVTTALHDGDSLEAG
jgi:hypothetical protein